MNDDIIKQKSKETRLKGQRTDEIAVLYILATFRNFIENSSLEKKFPSNSHKQQSQQSQQAVC